MNEIVSKYIQVNANIIPSDTIHYLFMGFKKQNAALLADVFVQLENEYEIRKDITVFNNAITELHNDLRGTYLMFIDAYKKFITDEIIDAHDHTNALKAMSMIASHFIVESIYAKTKYK